MRVRPPEMRSGEGDAALPDKLAEDVNKSLVGCEAADLMTSGSRTTGLALSNASMDGCSTGTAWCRAGWLAGRSFHQAIRSPSAPAPGTQAQESDCHSTGSACHPIRHQTPQLACRCAP